MWRELFLLKLKAVRITAQGQYTQCSDELRCTSEVSSCQWQAVTSFELQHASGVSDIQSLEQCHSTSQWTQSPVSSTVNLGDKEAWSKLPGQTIMQQDTTAGLTVVLWRNIAGVAICFHGRRQVNKIIRSVPSKSHCLETSYTYNSLTDQFYEVKYRQWFLCGPLFYTPRTKFLHSSTQQILLHNIL
jgi:hypothetical protein